MGERETQQRVRAVNIQFLADVRAVIIDRARMDKHNFADFAAGFLVGDQTQHASFGFRERTERGLWKAPANEPVIGIRGLQARISRAEQDVLNPRGVNVIRDFPERGMLLWGARTLSTDPEWKYIPVRRTALFIEESLFRGTKWVVFEPNDEPLWAQIRLNVGAFMSGLFRQGAFQGSTAQEAYYVKCDAETTTQADRNLGIVNIEVGFAPLKPAEFVVITIQQIAGDLQ